MNINETLKNYGYSIIEKNIIINDLNHLVVQLKNGKESAIQYDEIPLYFLKENRKNLTMDQVEELVKTKEAVKYTGKDIYEDYYDLNDEMRSYLTNNYGLRTKNVFDKAYEEICLISTRIEKQEEQEIKNLFIEEDFKLIKNQNGLWVGQKEFFNQHDEPRILKFYFNEKPNVQQLRRALSLFDIKSKFKTGELKEYINVENDHVYWIEENENLLEAAEKQL